MTPFSEIEKFFKNFEIPEGKIKMPSGFMCNPKKMVPMHISMIGANSGNYRFMPYYERLHFIYEHFKNDKNPHSKTG